MPTWLVNLLVSLAIRALEYFRDKDRLKMAHQDRIANIIPYDENPPPWKATNPNSKFMP